MHHRTFLTILVLLSTTWAFAQEKSVNPDINKSFKNADVPNYIKRFEREGRDVYDHRDEVVDAMNVKPRMIVADVGAGTGLFTGLFASRVGAEGQVYAVDISAPFIEHLEAKIQDAGMSQVQAVLCKEDSVELPAGSVDVAFICDTYHHFEYPQSTMESLHSAVRPGGSLVVVDFHRVVGARGDWVLEHIRAGQDVFTSEIEAAGFRFVEEVEIEGLEENYFLRFERK